MAVSLRNEYHAKNFMVEQYSIIIRQFDQALGNVIKDTDVYGWLEDSCEEDSNEFMFLTHSCDLIDKGQITSSVSYFIKQLKNRDVMMVDGFMFRDAHKCSMKIQMSTGTLKRGEYNSSNTIIKISIILGIKNPFSDVEIQETTQVVG